LVCEEVIDSDNSFNGYDSDRDPEYNASEGQPDASYFDPVDIDESNSSHVSKIL